ncbi:CsbD-like protein [Rhodopirellula sp. SWK7]|uniref:CsbD-like protein n=1 Tax=Rhodopirellula sp. SWK7 TaxID=595460 RepID=UPI0002BFB70D|nr:CsbD-like protein [Rhodopirellula sp. SWK7]EMI47104.1 CsbD-like protein [Rhodopirellula sp. SWK7]
MNWRQVKQQWPLVQAEVKRTWGRIDEADLVMIGGERDPFARILAQRYSYKAEDAERKLDAFVAQLDIKSKQQPRLAWIFRQLQKGWEHILVPRRH